MEAFFPGKAYAPHRHDTYTLAITTHGVQAFNYRGALRRSLPGQVVVLHPDELHDGEAGTEEGFAYRAICVAPSEVQAALGARPLPFVAGGVSGDSQLAAIVHSLLRELERSLEADEYQDTLFDLAQTLGRLAGQRQGTARVDARCVALARDYIDGHLLEGLELAELEHATGQSRWRLSRDFRALLGTSPYRYLIMRRLDLAKRHLLTGEPLAEVAHRCGFSDQSHFNRHFKSTFGLSPKRWLTSLRN
ncbi:MAG: AraC family transcriptional regulator [Pseudomonadota bacterium]